MYGRGDLVKTKGTIKPSVPSTVVPAMNPAMTRRGLPVVLSEAAYCVDAFNVLLAMVVDAVPVAVSLLMLILWIFS